MKTKEEKQILIEQIIALFPKNWSPEDEDKMMMLKIGAELTRLNKTINNLEKLLMESERWIQ